MIRTAIMRAAVVVPAASRGLSSGRVGRMEGRVAIVTASTAGIGLAIAQKLGEEGAKVMICSRKAENVQKAVDNLRKLNIDVHGTVCHVGKEEDRKRLVQETMDKFGGRIDTLISNAAANPAFGPLINTTGDQWDKIFDTNVKASFMLSKEVIPIMQQQNKGNIVFVTSIAAFSPLPGLGAYSISKTALLGLSHALAIEHAKDGIRVNSVAPGIIKTHFSQALWEDTQQEAKIIKQVPLGRVGVVNDIAGAVSFLASDEADYMTGETVCITGGMHTSRL